MDPRRRLELSVDDDGCRGRRWQLGRGNLGRRAGQWRAGAFLAGRQLKDPQGDARLAHHELVVPDAGDRAGGKTAAHQGRLHRFGAGARETVRRQGLAVAGNTGPHVADRLRGQKAVRGDARDQTVQRLSGRDTGLVGQDLERHDMHGKLGDAPVANRQRQGIGRQRGQLVAAGRRRQPGRHGKADPCTDPARARPTPRAHPAALRLRRQASYLLQIG